MEPISASSDEGWNALSQFITELIYRDKEPFTPKGNSERKINLSPSLHVVGLWEEARVPRENPHRHVENMLTTAPLCWLFST